MTVSVRKATVNNINQWRVYVDGELAAGCPSEYWANEIAGNFRVREEELELPLEDTDNMKNIHLIPTDKPSRLWVNNLRRRLELENENLIGSNTAQHIYITSDEEIKEGDWFTDDNNSLKRSYKLSHVQFANPKKIILTTDDQLIKDGVQAIDDDFLEWFVKNPSCEFVEINKEYLSNTGEWKEVLLPSEWEVDTKFRYKIIIPQEEPKPVYQQIIDLVGGEKKFKELVGLEPKLELPQLGTTEFVNMCESIFSGKPKQETLEEAAKKYKDLKLPDDLYDGFIAGAKSDAARDYWFKIFKENTLTR
jgi:hypothetical protein